MDRKKGLWDLFSITAKTFGTKCAVEDGNIVLDYAQLHSIATSFSGFLKVSADRNPFVVSLLPAGVNYLITSLATSAVGKIVVLIHDTYTKIQVEECLATLNSPLVVTTRSKWDSLSGINHTHVHFLPEEFDPNVPLPSSGEGGASSGEGQNEKDLKGVAYCFFTSGSTGTSKAVLLPATSISNSAQAVMATEPERFNSSMRGLMTVTISFVLSLCEVWPVFLSGGTICIPPAKVRLDMDTLRFWIRDQRITNATFSTPIMEMFLQNDIDKLEYLKWVTFGGTRLNPHRFNLKDAHFNAYQIYGSTEFFVGALGGIPKGTEHVSPSVGYPIPPLRMYVLDEAGNQVTTPEIRGEIFVAGMPGALMVGYHGQPEMTAKVLLPNPFDPEMSPMYKTGDTGYWSAAGTLFVVGRNDEVVKIHGRRLELGEIENALSCYPGIKQAVALVREIEGNKQIWAFCTLKDVVAQPKFEAVEEFLLERLQRHAIPRLIRFMSDFPRTPTGKISRFELFRLDVGNSEASNEATSEKTFHDFPDEMVQKIFMVVDKKDLVQRCRLVNKHWTRLSTEICQKRYVKLVEWPEDEDKKLDIFQIFNRDNLPWSSFEIEDRKFSRDILQFAFLQLFGEKILELTFCVNRQVESLLSALSLTQNLHQMFIKVENWVWTPTSLPGNGRLSLSKLKRLTMDALQEDNVEFLNYLIAGCCVKLEYFQTRLGIKRKSAGMVAKLLAHVPYISLESFEYDSFHEFKMLTTELGNLRIRELKLTFREMDTKRDGENVVSEAELFIAAIAQYLQKLKFEVHSIPTSGTESQPASFSFPPRLPSLSFFQIYYRIREAPRADYGNKFLACLTPDLVPVLEEVKIKHIHGKETLNFPANVPFKSVRKLTPECCAMDDWSRIFPNLTSLESDSFYSNQDFGNYFSLKNLEHLTLRIQKENAAYVNSLLTGIEEPDAVLGSSEKEIRRVRGPSILQLTKLRSLSIFVRSPEGILTDPGADLSLLQIQPLDLTIRISQMSEECAAKLKAHHLKFNRILYVGGGDLMTRMRNAPMD